jgi:glycosyltransferase involved in cell wall biosynthesis
MKVCIFSGNYANADIGGSHTFESQIFTALQEFLSESKHTFFLFKYGLNPLEELTCRPRSSHSIQTIKPYSASAKTKIKPLILMWLRAVIRQFKPLKMWLKQRELKALKREGIQLTLSLSPGYVTTEIPYIVIVWDLQHRLRPYFPEVSASGLWESRENHYSIMLRRASIVITGTETGKAEIEQFYQIPSERIKILPLPTPQFALDASPADGKQVLEKYNLPKNYLFYPAQFWAHKNHVGLLLAVKLLRDQYNLSFPVVFSGSDQGNLPHVQKVVHQLNLAEQVYFLGFVPQLDLIGLYRNAFALTYMSFCGPDNLPPLEAMALGCPVIASKVAGAEEQLGDAALLFDLQSTEQSAALAIKRLWDDPSLGQSLISRGLKRAYSWTPKDYGKRIFSILDEFEVTRRCWE